MATKLITGRYYSGYVLAAQYDTLDVLGGALITGGQGLQLNHPVTVNNLGSIGNNYTDNGITATAGATINNRYHAEIAGYSGVFAQNAAVVVNNYGHIYGGAAYGNGVFLAAGGRVVNEAGGYIYGHNCGVAIAGAATLANLGTIYGHGQAIAFSNGGSISNGSAEDSNATLYGIFGEAITILGAGGTVTNFGTILGPQGGISLASGGLITNNAGGVIESGAREPPFYKYAAGIETSGAAATVTNAGTILSLTYSGVVLRDGGAVANTGTIMGDAGYFGVVVFGAGMVTNGSNAVASALIEGGVYLETSGKVSNFGTIEGNGVTGVYLKTGSITNGGARDSAALIDGYYVGVRVGPSATVTNFGTIEGYGGFAPKAIEMSQTDTLIVEAGCAFVGAVLGGGGTLNLRSGTGTISGLFAAGGNVTVSGSMATTTFQNFGTVVISAGATFTDKGVVTTAAGQTVRDAGILNLSATAKDTNAGLIETTGAGMLTIAGPLLNTVTGRLAANGGTLVVNGAVTGGGAAAINGGTLDLMSSFNDRVAFTGTTGVLHLAQSKTYTANITGFSKSGMTSLDLGDIRFVGSTEATYSGTTSSGVLTVTDGTNTAHINLKGNYTTSTFVASSDGHNGTIVVDSTAKDAAIAPSSAKFIEAMAGLGASGVVGVIHTASRWQSGGSTLANPHVVTA